MKIRFFILFLTFFGVNFIFGEVFLLKNGDVITGKNIKMDEDTVFVLTSYGEISLDRENIENIFSDEEQYRLYKKSIESGDNSYYDNKYKDMIDAIKYNNDDIEDMIKSVGMINDAISEAKTKNAQAAIKDGSRKKEEILKIVEDKIQGSQFIYGISL